MQQSKGMKLGYANVLFTIYGPLKILLYLFRNFNFSNFKMTFEKSVLKQKPFLRNFQSSYKIQQFDKILPYENFRQYYGCPLHIFPYFSTKNNFSHIVIPEALYGDRNIKMGHSTFFTTLKHGDIMLDV